jgi:hypothetical protein
VTFTELQTNHIHYVKNEIKVHISKMRSKPWALLPLNDLILTGGVFASLLQADKPKDWDFYFTNYDSMMRVKELLENEGKSYVKDVDKEYKEVMGVDGKMITANAITMDDDSSFITMMHGTADAIKKTMDYVHCTPHYSLQLDKLFISPIQYKACVEKILYVNNPLALKEYRTNKFIKRGYIVGNYSESNL